MKYPNWTDPQFLDANGIGGFNGAMQTVSGSVANVGLGVWALPGLVAPDTATFTASGMVMSSTLPPGTFGVISSGGAVVRAHGVQTGADTDAYLTDFAPLIPVTGSVTAYLAATITQIQQDPFPIPGPPPGFPSYNPGFVPSIGYATNVQSLALAAVTGGIDNISTFELLRTTLTAGQTGIASFTTAGQFRAPLREAMPGLVLNSGGTLTPAQASQVISPSSAGLTFTVPPTAEVGGLTYVLVNPTSGNLTLATSGSDVINGFGIGGASSVNIASSGSLSLWTAGSGVWNVLSAGACTVMRTNPGYIVMPGGMIVQNGALTMLANSNSSINYAIPFLGGNTAFISTVSINGTGAASVYPPTMNINSAGAGSGNFIAYNPNAVAINFTWTVWGY